MRHHLRHAASPTASAPADLQTDSHCGPAARLPRGTACAAAPCVTTCGTTSPTARAPAATSRPTRATAGCAGAPAPPAACARSARCTVSCGAGLTNCSGVCRDLITTSPTAAPARGAAGAGRYCSGRTMRECRLRRHDLSTTAAASAATLLTTSPTAARAARACASGAGVLRRHLRGVVQRGLTNCSGVCATSETTATTAACAGAPAPRAPRARQDVRAVSCGAGSPRAPACAATPRRPGQLRDVRSRVPGTGQVCAFGCVRRSAARADGLRRRRQVDLRPTRPTAGRAATTLPGADRRRSHLRPSGVRGDVHAAAGRVGDDVRAEQKLRQQGRRRGRRERHRDLSRERVGARATPDARGSR